MTDQPVDRRVRRTKHRLKAALLQLIEERDYERITIEQITRRADVGRSTFYSHYADKEDLLFAGFDRWLQSLADAVPGGDDPGADGVEGERPRRFRFSLPLLRHMRSQRRFFQVTIARGSNARVQRRVTALLAELVRRELERMSAGEGRAAREGGSGPGATGSRQTGAAPDAEAGEEARAHAIVGAFLGLAAWWLDAGEALSAEAVDALFQDLMVRGAAASSGTCPDVRDRAPEGTNEPSC